MRERHFSQYRGRMSRSWILRGDLREIVVEVEMCIERVRGVGVVVGCFRL